MNIENQTGTFNNQPTGRQDEVIDSQLLSITITSVRQSVTEVEGHAMERVELQMAQIEPDRLDGRTNDSGAVALFSVMVSTAVKPMRIAKMAAFQACA